MSRALKNRLLNHSSTSLFKPVNTTSKKNEKMSSKQPIQNIDIIKYNYEIYNKEPVIDKVTGQPITKKPKHLESTFLSYNHQSKINEQIQNSLIIPLDDYRKLIKNKIEVEYYKNENNRLNDTIIELKSTIDEYKFKCKEGIYSKPMYHTN